MFAYTVHDEQNENRTFWMEQTFCGQNVLSLAQQHFTYAYTTTITDASCSTWAWKSRLWILRVFVTICCLALSIPEQKCCRERGVIILHSLLFTFSKTNTTSCPLFFIFPTVQFNFTNDAPHPSLGMIYKGRAECFTTWYMWSANSLKTMDVCLCSVSILTAAVQVLLFLDGMNKWTFKHTKDRRADTSHLFKNVFVGKLQWVLKVIDQIHEG